MATCSPTDQSASAASATRSVDTDTATASPCTGSGNVILKVKYTLGTNANTTAKIRYSTDAGSSYTDFASASDGVDVTDVTESKNIGSVSDISDMRLQAWARGSATLGAASASFSSWSINTGGRRVLILG